MLKLGQKFLTHSDKLMEVYEETSSDGKKYLAARSVERPTQDYNGAIRFYEEGYYGGIKQIFDAQS